MRSILYTGTLTDRKQGDFLTSGEYNHLLTSVVENLDAQCRRVRRRVRYTKENSIFSGRRKITSLGFGKANGAITVVLRR